MDKQFIIKPDKYYILKSIALLIIAIYMLFNTLKYLFDNLYTSIDIIMIVIAVVLAIDSLIGIISSMLNKQMLIITKHEITYKTLFKSKTFDLKTLRIKEQGPKMLGSLLLKDEKKSLYINFTTFSSKKRDEIIGTLFAVRSSQ